MCCRRSFGVSTWSTGISLDVPALTPRRRHPGHLSRVALLELANPRFELERQADLVPAGAQHLLAERVDSKRWRVPSGAVTVCASRSTPRVAPGRSWSRRRRPATTSADKIT